MLEKREILALNQAEETAIKSGTGKASQQLLFLAFNQLLTVLDDDARCIAVFQIMQEKFPKILQDEHDFDMTINVHFAPKQREIFKKIWSINNDDKLSISIKQKGSPRLFTSKIPASLPSSEIKPVQSQAAEPS